MRHGFVKVAAATPDIRVADVEFNKENICRGIEEAEKANAKILCGLITVHSSYAACEA